MGTPEDIMSYKTYLAGAPAYGTHPYGATGMLYPGHHGYGYGYGYAVPTVEDMKKAREGHESMVAAAQAKHQEFMEAEKKRCEEVQAAEKKQYEEFVEARKAAIADPACYYGAGYGYPGYAGYGYGYPYGRSNYGDASAAQRIRARCFY